MIIRHIEVSYKRSISAGPAPACVTLGIVLGADLGEEDDEVVARHELFEEARAAVREQYALLKNGSQA